MFNGGGTTLPGGYWSGGRLEKTVTFRSVTGHIEQALSVAEESETSVARFVSRVLGTIIEKVGTADFGPAEAAALCVADRQWLMLQLAILLNGDRVWLTAMCRDCASTMDIPVNLSELPLKPAGKNFPRFRLRIKKNDIDLRVPTGADQEALAGLDEAAAAAYLLEHCVEAVDGKPPGHQWLATLPDKTFEAIEAALEEASPAVATMLMLACPECGAEQLVAFNPYGFFRCESFGLLDEIHTLALYYHWSEQEILGLSRNRRRSYLKLIERSRGMET